MIRWLGYALAASLWISATASAEVSEIINYTYYELQQAGADQPLKAQLDAATPITRKGRKLHGETRWQLDWRFNTKTLNDGSCRIEDIVIHLDALIHLPELGYSDRALQAEFNRYAEALQRHQIGHYIIAIQAANKIDVRLTYMEPTTDCATARHQANTMALAIEQEHRDKEVAFDKKTDFGAEQGVTFDEPKPPVAASELKH